MAYERTARMTGWRHYLHRHPELSCYEAGTAAYVAAQLDALGIQYWVNIGGHGIVAQLARGAGRSIGLRADMDALPIAESTGAAHASCHAGVMHACGHDGHAASLLGAAEILRDDPDWRGTINLIFQPAEEGYGGAEAMLADGLLARFPMSWIFGYHNWPGLPLGTVALHDGAVMAAAANFTVTLHGRAGHAAMPHLTADPVQGLAHLVIAFNTIVARNADPLQAGVISTCTLAAGEARNQIPHAASAAGTMRALSDSMMSLMQTRMTELSRHIAAAHDLTADLKIDSTLAATVNDPAAVALAEAAARQAGLTVRRDMAPSMAAEDFGRFLRDIPGAYAWLGNGPSAALHSPAYDYNDALLPLAATYLAATAKAALA
ncbi:amidohydrolase [Acidocella sp.]|uniref:amidohydrolase n=1 Tax=Acidocella sp. TaxID=50710 RepID=UPI0026171C86|nr:amidohydrolase [Acidocella sp.]